MRNSIAGAFVLTLLVSALAHAQTISVAVKVQSLWSPVAAQGLSISGVTVAPLRMVNTLILDPVTKQPVLDADGNATFSSTYALILGKTQKIGDIKFLQTPLAAVFPGSKTAMMMIAGLRFSGLVSGPGWRVKDSAIIDVEVMPTMGFPAGQQVAMRYDAPSFTTAGGTIQLVGCPMTITAAACLATIPPAPAGPVVTGPIVPASPPPGTAPVASNPGDSVPPLTQLVSSDLSVWTRNGDVVLRNGVDTAQPLIGLTTMKFVVGVNSRIQISNPTQTLCWITGSGWWSSTVC